MKKKRLITSALPYVNNIPHLGNLIQVLSADVFSRFCRLKGYETLYVCGTDEYGTATETRALEEGVSPKELCDRYYKIHSEIYSWFNIAFDHFGRTSTQWQTDIVQDIFKKVDAAGYITEQTIEQLYCESCDRFLADRFVRGTCPHCGYEDARGDQCENCGKLLDPTDLIDPRCGLCGQTPKLRSTSHLYLDLPKIRPRLEEWIDKASVEGFWARNAIQMTRSWIRDGLKERCITRDLKWGIPVPKPGYEGKVFYVWFDAPIGYISITANLTDEWETWWKNPDEVDLFQFIGKDNIPFHTVIFPSSLIASGDNWTLLHHMSSTEYLNYESGKFSKSKGIGVFGTDARDTGIPADVWRFYIFYNRPEKSDALFTWSDFQEKVNGELIGNLGNLVNRTLTFVSRFYDGKLPEAAIDADMAAWIREREAEITEHFERAELRDAFRKIFALSSYGNKAFQEGEPWKLRKENPEAAATLLSTLVYLVRDLGVLVEPFIPETSGRMLSFFGIGKADWEILGDFKGISSIEKPEILFERLEDERIASLRERFSGSQKEREAREKEKEMEEKAEQEKPLAERFAEAVDIRVAKIIEIERHPEADKLYIEKIDLGYEQRTIVSGLVPYYKEEELLGHNILLVYNLKPAKLRGVKSEGMLLAADDETAPEEERSIEVLFADWAEPGSRISLAGLGTSEGDGPKRISANTFFSMPIGVEEWSVKVDGKNLEVAGKAIKTNKVKKGSVG
ncbi:methionine--tRNA ligase [Sediminispirochaeta smaragdinae]|jgi:methionyl-tRNA synthetase|uniref:Methionine--tRNA ligase n=1 Tax=Sediminispirochaeta smaragdinae (strain DSM 11293 / JCM 15392 / SEBR 4228) TaxID=573413 RepID=E1R3M1_SEDSS|nr:methionine--tRNA ligase [Sediminispirochaeta smaragdinae]ADK81992.1 methionyl-tRNA synthetase [Sediminispirochaeta smaragdinae DSM 11293]